MNQFYIDGFVTAVLISLYIGELYFQWTPLYRYNKPYGSRTATVIALTKYALSLGAFLFPYLNVTQIAAIALVGIGLIKETGYLYKLVQLKRRLHIKI